uniref:Uncharacterized protein n=1 Tax=Sphaerodactylus townsendi TaxID=933632 RepID=A0ACB8F9B7_9SAUR
MYQILITKYIKLLTVTFYSVLFIFPVPQDFITPQPDIFTVIFFQFSSQLTFLNHISCFSFLKILKELFIPIYPYPISFVINKLPTYFTSRTLYSKYMIKQAFKIYIQNCLVKSIPEFPLIRDHLGTSNQFLKLLYKLQITNDGFMWCMNMDSWV